MPVLYVNLLVSMTYVGSLGLLLLNRGCTQAVKVGVGHSHAFVFISATLLAKAIATFYNPMKFVNLTMPRIAQLLFGGTSRQVLIPNAVLAKLVDVLLYSVVTGGFLLPIGYVATLLNIPIVL